MHYLLRKPIAIMMILLLTLSSSFSSIFAGELFVGIEEPVQPVPVQKNENCTKKTVQGWNLNSTDFSNIVGDMSYNGNIIISLENLHSIQDFITEINNNYQKYATEKGVTPYSFAYDSLSNIIYIIDSDSNPLDSKDGIEIVIHNKNDDSFIIGDGALKDNGYGYTQSLLYSYQGITDCSIPPKNNQCTITTVQGWLLNGSDFSNMAIRGNFNGKDIFNNKGYTSIDQLLQDINKAYNDFAIKNEITIQTFAYNSDMNMIYLVDSDKNPLDSTKDTIELYVQNDNNGIYFIEDNTESDKGFTNGLVYSNQDIKTCTTPPSNQCTKNIVQGWKLNGSDFSNMHVLVLYNGDYISDEKNITSVEDVIINLNKQFEKYNQSKGSPLYTFSNKGNILYITDSDKNPLDSTKDTIELYIQNDNDESYIIEDNNQLDGGKNKGLIYSNQDLSDCNNTCTSTTVQGWLLNGSDFSNMGIRIDFNGKDIFNNKGYTSIDKLLQDINKAYNDFAIKNEITIQTFAYNSDMNMIYLVDSDKNPLDRKQDNIELLMTNNTNNSEIIRDTDQTDGGYTDGLVYSNQNIPCKLPPEENQCTPMTVQGWLLNGNDFSNMKFEIEHNGELFAVSDYTSLNDLIVGANESITSYQGKKGGLLYSLIIKDNIIYINDTDKNPIDPKKDVIEIRIYNNNQKGGTIILDTDQTDGGYTNGLVYSNQDLANCDSVTPPKPEINIPKFVCSHKMKGFDISLLSMNGNPSEIYFHGIEDDSTIEGKYVSTPISQINNAEIQVFLNKIYGENKVIRYFNEDESIVTVRYDNTIDYKKIYILMGDINNVSNKFNSDRETKHNLCPISAPSEPTRMNVESVCAPDEVTDNKQKVTCTFIITNKGPSAINTAHSSGFTPFNGFIVTDQGGFSSRDIAWDVGQVEKYTVVGYQTKFPKEGSENIAIGSFNFEYVDPRDGALWNMSPVMNIKTSTLVIPDTTPPVTPTILTLEGEKNKLYTTKDGAPMITYNKPSINGIGEIGSTIIAIINDNQYSTIVNKNGEWKISIDKALKDNNYIAYITSVDTSGNKSKEANVSFIINTSTGTAPAIIVAPIEKSHTINIINTGTNTTGSTMVGGIVNSGATTPASVGVKSAAIIDTIKKESVKETISRTSERATNYCIYEDPMPLNAWQDVTDAEYSNDIKNLIGKCIVNGFDNQMLYFGPNKIIKKAEAVKIIAKWFKLPLSTTTVDSNKRWSIYLKTLQDSKALKGLESTWNEKTMEQGVVGDDVVMILKNINPDSNTNLVDLLKTKKVSRKVFAHVITQQIQ